jgi:hypothetical protein
MWILFTIIEVVVNKKQNMKKIVNCLINEAVENVDQVVLPPLLTGST